MKKETIAKKDSQERAQELIHDLYNRLIQRPNPQPKLIEINEVLLQVYQTLETEKNPEPLINRLVNYIYRVGFDHKIHFDREEEALMIGLGTIANRAGLNGVYRSDASDKKQFYPLFKKKAY